MNTAESNIYTNVNLLSITNPFSSYEIEDIKENMKGQNKQCHLCSSLTLILAIINKSKSILSVPNI
jgi:hypothetical protein